MTLPLEAPWQSLVFIYSVGRSRRTAISQALIAVGMSCNVEASYYIEILAVVGLILGGIAVLVIFDF